MTPSSNTAPTSSFSFQYTATLHALIPKPSSTYTTATAPVCVLIVSTWQGAVTVLGEWEWALKEKALG